MIDPANIDIDAYIDALPSYRLREPRHAPSRYRTWNTPLLKTYNGFTGLERRRGGQLIRWLQDAGCLVTPTYCQICGSRDRVQWHSENYFSAIRAPALCSSCHRMVHLRPWRWNEWRRLVDSSAITGREWFALAPREGIDIAQHLRNRWGWDAARIDRSPITPLPETIAHLLPTNLLPHPSI